ncbi:MAG: hypothetical protein AB1508_01600 [Pseudomonadota bacterium]
MDLVLSACLSGLLSSAALAQTQRTFAFDIPAQSLSSALEAYGAATHEEVFYDAALAAGRRSTMVKGVFSAPRGLEMILRGTGYMPRTTGTGMISIVPVTGAQIAEVAARVRALRRYDWYFAVLQKKLGRVLCDSDRSGRGNGEIVFKFWLTQSGTILRAEVIASGGDPLRDQSLTDAARGLDIGQPPPADLPEPITMAIFAPAAGEQAGCHE